MFVCVDHLRVESGCEDSEVLSVDALVVSKAFSTPYTSPRLFVSVPVGVDDYLAHIWGLVGDIFERQNQADHCC
jgi:hypothetical protein